MNPRGHIARVEDFDAADARAIAVADENGARPKELWCSSRGVEQWAGTNTER